MKDSWTIAVDAKRLFHNKEGLGQYARTLMKEMQALNPQHSYILCTPSLSKDYPYFLDNKRFSILQPGKQILPWYWRQKGIVNDLRRHKVDFFIGLSNEIPKGLKSTRIKSVVSIHDLLYKVFPQQFTKVDRLIYHRKFTHAVQQSDAIMVTSHATKKDLLRYHGPNKDKIHVIYQSVMDVASEIIPLQERQHFLAVGTINERKNLDLLVEAYNLLPLSHRKPVVVVGKGRRYEDNLKLKVKEYGLETYFDFKGYVTDKELNALYMQAVALVFPSKYEGFGRPVIESISLGTPVITGNNSSLPEVVGKHGIIIEYDRPEHLRDAMMKINQLSTSKELLEGRMAHLQKFTAQEHITLIMNMLYKLI